MNAITINKIGSLKGLIGELKGMGFDVTKVLITNGFINILLRYDLGLFRFHDFYAINITNNFVEFRCEWQGVSLTWFQPKADYDRHQRRQSA